MARPSSKLQNNGLHKSVQVSKRDVQPDEDIFSRVRSGIAPFCHLIAPVPSFAPAFSIFIPFRRTPTALRNFARMAKWYYTEFEKVIIGGVRGCYQSFCLPSSYQTNCGSFNPSKPIKRPNRYL